MDFKEYINQEDPKRCYNVKVIESDCKHIKDVSMFKDCRKIITLEISGIEYRYLLTTQNDILYTMDEFGNPKKVSCFTYFNN